MEPDMREEEDVQGPLTSHDVPQADTVERVLDLTVSIVDGAEPTDESLGLQPRNLRYYAHAAFVLGLLDRDGHPTPIGEAFTAMHPDRYLPRLALAFAESRVGRRWVAWAGVRHIGDLDPASAEEFLRAASDLSESTARRRAATLHAWQRTLGHHLPQAFRPTQPSERPPALITSLGAPAPDLGPEADLLVPGLPERGQRLFREVARDVDPSELTEVRAQVRDHLAEFHIAAEFNELLPADIAEALATALDHLLEGAPSMTAANRALAVGAARYFVSDEDATPDLEGVLGLDDDVTVFNWVARRIGREDLTLDL
ncbi:MAG: hypothetical protein ACOCXM_10830 [Myxococcota bacterium]